MAVTYIKRQPLDDHAKSSRLARPEAIIPSPGCAGAGAGLVADRCRSSPRALVLWGSVVINQNPAIEDPLEMRQRLRTVSEVESLGAVSVDLAVQEQRVAVR